MRTLSLLRHAKSGWSINGISDFERPLKKRGYKDILTMSSRFNANAYRKPDLVMTSPATRALTTARLFCENIDFPKEDIQQRYDIYECNTVDLYQLLSNSASHCEHILLVGHNPSITYFAIELCQLHTTNVPTTGLVNMSLAIDNWSQLKAGCGSLINFDYPKRVE